jgi:phosphatidylinositol 4-kinase
MLSYFHNEGINSSVLFGQLASIADQVTFIALGSSCDRNDSDWTRKVNEAFRRALNDQVVRHNIDPVVYTEVRRILVECCRPADQVRSIALRYMDALVNSFPSLLCESSVVTACLEVLTLLRRACEAQYEDTVSCSRLQVRRCENSR